MKLYQVKELYSDFNGKLSRETIKTTANLVQKKLYKQAMLES